LAACGQADICRIIVFNKVLFGVGVHSALNSPLISDEANLDEGALWPVAFALKELTAAEEARISVLVKKAVS
jgi:hypothetical protein